MKEMKTNKSSITININLYILSKEEDRCVTGKQHKKTIMGFWLLKYEGMGSKQGTREEIKWTHFLE